MSLVNMISSLNKDDNAILKMAIDRKHLSAFLKHLEEFKGAFMKVKLISIVGSMFYEFSEEEGKQVFRKIHAIIAIKRDAKDNDYSLMEVRNFVEKNGTLNMTVGDMKKLEDLGFVLEEVE